MLGLIMVIAWRNRSRNGYHVHACMICAVWKGAKLVELSMSWGICVMTDFDNIDFCPLSPSCLLGRVVSWWYVQIASGKSRIWWVWRSAGWVPVVLQQSRDNHRSCLDRNFKFSRNREILLSIYQLSLRLSRFVSAHHRDTCIETTQCSIPN